MHVIKGRQPLYMCLRSFSSEFADLDIKAVINQQTQGAGWRKFNISKVPGKKSITTTTPWNVVHMCNGILWYSKHAYMLKV